MYCDMFGIETSSSQVSNSFNLTENNYKKIAHEIALTLKGGSSIFFNIQLPSEGSQYDVWMDLDYFNQGIHQRGIHCRDLLIGIIGGGCFGFDCDKLVITSTSYYYEKLKVCSELLSLLFNYVRMEIGGREICS